MLVVQSFGRPRPRKYAKYAHVTRTTKMCEFYITRSTSCGRTAERMTTSPMSRWKLAQQRPEPLNLRWMILSQDLLEVPPALAESGGDWPIRSIASASGPTARYWQHLHRCN